MTLRWTARRWLGAWLVVALAWSTGAHAGPAAPSFSARVVGVADGDTITVLRERESVRIRLAEIDAPEKRQAFGQRAKARTAELAFGKTVTVTPVARDRYGRLVAEVRLPDGRSLNRQLVEDGLAWHYVKYSRNAAIAALEADARRTRRGLWVDPHAQPPWAFRHPEASAPPGVGYVSPEPPPAGAVVANRKSRVYHLPGCPGFARVSPRNRALFDTASAAEKAGYRRAGNCR